MLFASPVGFHLHSDESLEHLLSQSNVHFRNVDLWTYARDTPVDELINDALINNELQPSVMFFTNQLEENLADYLRFIRFGQIRGRHFLLNIVFENVQPLQIWRYLPGAGRYCSQVNASAGNQFRWT